MSIYKQQREQVKRSILDTSVSIFRNKGYENTTVEEITETVGIAKGTFYNFYGSKSDILITWAAEKFQTVPVHEAFNITNSLEKNLNRFIEILIDATEDEEQLFHSFLKEVPHVDKAYNSKFDFIQIYGLIIENSNDFEKVAGSLLDVKIAVLNSSLYMGIVSWFEAGNPVEGLCEYLMNIVQVCLYGLLGDAKGR